jgi:hypothetical protein
MRAIGLQPKQIKPPAPMPLSLPHTPPANLPELALPNPTPAQHPEHDSNIQLASGNDATPNSVVSAIATSADRQPSIVKIPAMKVDLPVVQNQTAQDLATSRSIGAKVRLSAGSFVTSDAVNAGVASIPGQANSSNIKVTRSGDITAETPVKLSFNADQVVALPAFPSPNSPYAKSGIEIPVRVESVSNAMNALPTANTPAPSIVPLPTLELPPLTPPATPPSIPTTTSPSANLPIENSVNSTEALATDTPSLTPELSPRDSQQEPTVTEIESVSLDSEMSDESEKDIATQDHTAAQNDTAAQEVIATHEVSAINPSDETQTTPTNSPVPVTNDLSSKVVSTPAPVFAPRSPNTVIAAPIMSGVPVSLPSDADAAKLTATSSQNTSGIPVTTGPLVITLGSTQMDADRAEKMQVESQAMRALQTKGSISKVHIVDGSVCRVVANGNRLFVVGDQPGETLVEVSTDNGAKPTYVKVCVVKPWQQANKSSVAVDQVASIISHLVPDADVEVQPQPDGSLLVKGMVESKEQAKKIVSSIRKMVLVPVVDALEIQ